MRDIIQGIKNMIVWLPIIWNDRDFDYSYLLKIVRFKLKRMLPAIENGHYVGCEKDAKRMRVAIELLDRQLDGAWYYENARLFGDVVSRRLINQWIKHENQDWDYLFDLLKKYLRGWWD